MYLACCGLKNEDERQSAPLTETLHCTSTRRASSRFAGGAGTGETPTAENEREMLLRRPAHVHSAHAAICCWSTAFSPHPARSADWPHGPCLALSPCIPGEIHDLTWVMLQPNLTWHWHALVESIFNSRIALRDTWSKRQAGAMRPFRKVGWVWAAGCTPAAEKLRGLSARAQARRIKFLV